MAKKDEQTVTVRTQKWRMALTDAANFGEKLVADDKAAMRKAWGRSKKTEPAPVNMTRDEYAHAARVHDAMAKACHARGDTNGKNQSDRHAALSDMMNAIATVEWTPQKELDAAAAAKAAADAKADAVAKVAAMMAELGIDATDL